MDQTTPKPKKITEKKFNELSSKLKQNMKRRKEVKNQNVKNNNRPTNTVH